MNCAIIQNLITRLLCNGKQQLAFRLPKTRSIYMIHCIIQRDGTEVYDTMNDNKKNTCTYYIYLYLYTYELIDCLKQGHCANMRNIFFIINSDNIYVVRYFLFYNHYYSIRNTLSPAVISHRFSSQALIY